MSESQNLFDAMPAVAVPVGVPAGLYRFESKPVRVVKGPDGELWFVAADVCRILDLSNVTKAVRILDEDERKSYDTFRDRNFQGANINDLGVGTGNNVVTVISEPGLYKLIARSRKPEAARFDRWVRHEVLPSIRRTGSYGMRDPMEVLNDPAALRGLLATYSEKVLALQAENAELEPKADALDRIAEADGSLNLTAAAKVLQVRPKQLIDFLRAKGWIYRRPGGSLLGYQDKTSSALLTHKTATILRADGSEKVCEQVRITPKGLAKLALLMKPAGSLLS